jgi:hypothetical protein
VPLTVGILIIGSLLWDERRQAWRNARLDMASIDTVTAPSLRPLVELERQHLHDGILAPL